MPELPEVEITRQKLLPLVCGKTILDFWTDWPKGLKIESREKSVENSMRGRKILDITRHGKVLLFKLSPRLGSGQAGPKTQILAIHLRMSGRLAVVPKRELRSRWTHFIWKLSGNRELRFIDPRKFGRVWYGSPKDFIRDPYLGRLGRDVKHISRETFHNVFGRARGMIKPFLLRQDRFAGIGNIIADESLWRAKIHPCASITTITQAERDKLFYSLRSTLSAMLTAGGTTLRDWGHPDGAKGSFQHRRKVYGKARLPCPRCRAVLTRIVVASRGTTMCPKCQHV